MTVENIRLGINQAEVLDALDVHGEWFPDCGWHWKGNGRTRSILISLERKALVREVTGTSWAITPKGRQWLALQREKEPKLRHGGRTT